MITIGQRIGEYVISEKLGRGGFGEVWLAQRDGKPFAIKFAVGQQIDWKAIAQEIGLWVLCGRHPNILQLIEARNFDGQIALISEYAADGSLDQLIKTTSGLDELKAVSIAIEILNGLDHLHSKGIIHRDLKPANVLLHGEQARIADFGISRIISSETSSETISGTFAYMAPECFDGKRNAQTDIWSVGIILFQMLTGDLPFKGKEPTATIASIIMNYVDPIEEIECLLEGDVDVSSRNRLTQILTPYLGFTYRIFRERWARSQDLNFEHEVNRTIDHFANEYRFSREQLSNLESFTQAGRLMMRFKCTPRTLPYSLLLTISAASAYAGKKRNTCATINCFLASVPARIITSASGNVSAMGFSTSTFLPA